MRRFLGRRASTLRPKNFLLACLILTLTLTLTTHAQDAKSAPTTVKVKRGQTLSLSLLTPVDSGHANVGDDVTVKLVRPLVADGATVLPAEWILPGKVTKVKRAGKNCQDGEIAWKLDPITTPGGDLLKVQEVHSYPFKYFVTSGDPVWVPLDTPLSKIGGTVKIVALLPVVVAFSPLMIPMAIAMSADHCAGKAGAEKSLPLGLGDLYAVSRDARVTPLP